jgi:hypothetical protein
LKPTCVDDRRAFSFELRGGTDADHADWCKLDEWVREQHERILEIWSDADRPYSADSGVHPRDSIAKGRLTPEEAAKEHQRQKDMGWDVKGNVAL